MSGILVSIIAGAAFIIQALLWLAVVAIFATAIISWLVAFDVINLRNRFAYTVAHFLDRVTRPILRPFQRIIPPLGGVDISPMIAALILIAIRLYLIPAIAVALIGLVGGNAPPPAL